MFSVIYQRGNYNRLIIEPFHLKQDADNFLQRLSLTNDCQGVLIEGEITETLGNNVITHHRKAKDTRR